MIFLLVAASPALRPAGRGVESWNRSLELGRRRVESWFNRLVSVQV